MKMRELKVYFLYVLTALLLAGTAAPLKAAASTQADPEKEAVSEQGAEHGVEIPARGAGVEAPAARAAKPVRGADVAAESIRLAPVGQETVKGAASVDGTERLQYLIASVMHPCGEKAHGSP